MGLFNNGTFSPTTIECPECEGKGYLQCINCEGTGHEYSSNSHSKRCSDCGGTGRIKCQNCLGMGWLPR